MTQNTGNPELDREIGRLTEQLGMLQDLPAKMAEITGTAETAKGFIKVTVDSSGKVTALEINPRAMRMDSQQLAEEVLTAAQEAYDDLQESMRELLAPSGDVQEMVGRIMSGEGVKDLPEDIADGPAAIARAEDPMKELTAQLKRLQGLL